MLGNKQIAKIFLIKDLNFVTNDLFNTLRYFITNHTLAISRVRQILSILYAADINRYGKPFKICMRLPIDYILVIFKFFNSWEKKLYESNLDVI